MIELRKFERVIKKIAYKLSTRDREFRKDLCQEMRLALWQAPEGHKYSWYTQYARFKAIDYMRKSIPHIWVDGKRKNSIIYMGTTSYLEQFEGSVRTWLSEGWRRKKPVRYNSSYEHDGEF